MTLNRPNLEPIAICGIGCRFPGDADSPERFWTMLIEGRDGVTDVPANRWNSERFYDPDPSVPGKMYVRNAAFIRQSIDSFDAAFFGISPREAAHIDPQQRLLLEVAWEALEDAGVVIEQRNVRDTGVFIGGFTTDNLLRQLSPFNRTGIGPYAESGSTLSILANRISYVFDFTGPSVALDTACSSSLVALHQACQALRSGECKMALVGGVNIMHRPESPIAMCKAGFLAPDGRCKSFDARADGYGRGEGAGVVVLKSLKDARESADQVYAVIVGTGVNQDGRSDGMTVPNANAQTSLMQRVHKLAGVSPSQIRYVEAHGTGTPVGDPIEAAAIGAAIGSARSTTDPCVIGTLKPNIGHLEAAAGIAGLIKAALCLKHQKIPPLANLLTVNPNIPFSTLNLRLPLEVESLSGEVGLRCIAVNSFGYGGTNAHALLQEELGR